MAVSDGPLLVTERLELWRPVKEDRAAQLAIVSDPETTRYLGRGHDAADHFQRFGRNAGSWFLYGYGAYTVRLRGRDEIVGNCGVFHSWRGLGEDFDDKPEAGWIIRADQTKPVSAGVFDATKDGSAAVSLENLPVETVIKGLAVTLEPRGGVEQTTNTDFIVAGDA